MYRLVIACLLEAVLSVSAFAQGVSNPEPTGAVSPPAVVADTPVDAAEPNSAYAIHRIKRERPSSLPMLYMGATALQSYDTALTLGVIGSGVARETNPFMKNVVESPAAFVALKAGVTATAILTAEHLWKNHNRSSAVALMVVTNVILGVVAVKNTHEVH